MSRKTEKEMRLNRSLPNLAVPRRDFPREPIHQQGRIGLAVSALLIFCVLFAVSTCAAQDHYAAPTKLRQVKLPAASAGRDHPIDRIIDHYLRGKGIAPPKPVDDATFVRRATLDLVGLLPKEKFATAFISNQSPSKREKLIEFVLSDETDYAEHWLTFWNDWLVNDYDGEGIETGDRVQITKYLYESLINNVAYDVFVRELVSPTLDSSRGFLHCIRTPGKVTAQQGHDMQFAHKISQVFLGINGKCASCHDSRINNWTQETIFNLAAISATEELFIESNGVVSDQLATPAWPFEGAGGLSPLAPRLTRLNAMSWLVTDKANAHFSRAIANRLWAKLMGRGISHPLDGMHHRPWNAPLLEYLAGYLVENKFDLKALLGHIATSQAYQSQSRIDTIEESNRSGQYVYRGPHAKRMTAEQFLDGVWRIAGITANKTAANLVRGSGRGFDYKDQKVSANWIWRDMSKGPKAAIDGEHLVFRRTVKFDSPVAHGAAAICGDNEFEMFLDGRLVTSSDDWLKVQSVSLQGLGKGSHEILIVIRSFSAIPERSGLLFQADIELVDGTQMIVVSDRDWEFTRERPSIRAGRQINELNGPWQNPVLMQRPAIYSQVTMKKFKEIIAKELGSRSLPQRASLLARDQLMTLFNRPQRTRVVSDRSQKLSRAQWLQLINGDAFADLVATAAKRLLQEHQGNLGQMINSVFQRGLSRAPTIGEKNVMGEMLRGKAATEAAEDFLWSIFLAPEFLTVR